MHDSTLLSEVTFAGAGRYNEVVMSRFTTEADIESVIDYLGAIVHASRLNDDEKLRRLSRDADDMARILKNAQQNVHRHWEKD